MLWRILCYHRIDPSVHQAFGRQLKRFLRRGFQFCSITEGIEKLESTDLFTTQSKWLTVSFDDGDHTIYDVAQPELDALGIKAMLYITTDFVCQGSIYNNTPLYPAIHWEQLQDWVKAGHEVGSHTHTHTNLTTCSHERLLEELHHSWVSIRSHLGITPIHLSYPWGQYSKAVHQTLTELNLWRSAATIDRGWNRAGVSLFCLKRDLMEAGWSDRKSDLRMAVGNCEWLYTLQRRLRHLNRNGIQK